MDKNKLFARRLKESEVEIPDVGTVRIRALTREEVLKLGIVPGSAVELDIAVAEQKMLSKAMVDPEMSENDIRQWQENSPAMEINIVFEAVLKMSGLAPGTAKEMVKQFPQQAGLGV